jgi:hypothetical protein
MLILLMRTLQTWSVTSCSIAAMIGSKIWWTSLLYFCDLKLMSLKFHAAYYSGPEVIFEAAEMMEIRGAGQTVQGRAFAADVLRLEVVGQTGLHLTVVDLPGLIAVANEEQSLSIFCCTGCVSVRLAYCIAAAWPGQSVSGFAL